VERRFGATFEIERAGGTDRPQPRTLIPGWAAYLMTRR
jgi:hypothetical protein